MYYERVTDKYVIYGWQGMGPFVRERVYSIGELMETLE